MKCDFHMQVRLEDDHGQLQHAAFVSKNYDLLMAPSVGQDVLKSVIIRTCSPMREPDSMKA